MKFKTNDSLTLMLATGTLFVTNAASVLNNMTIEVASTAK